MAKRKTDTMDTTNVTWMPGTTNSIVPMPLDVLARRINEAHKEARHAARNMVAFAIEAGNLLLQVKASLPHGEFKPWIAANCQFSYATAKRYMVVAKRLVDEPFDPDEIMEASIMSLNGHETRHGHVKARAAKASTGFDQDDAERALKLHTAAQRGDEAIRETAKAKLDAMAEGFGWSTEKLIAEAATKAPWFDCTTLAKENTIELARKNLMKKLSYYYPRLADGADSLSFEERLIIARSLYSELEKVIHYMVEVQQLRAEVAAIKRRFNID